jgi:hypothetical protein
MHRPLGSLSFGGRVRGTSASAALLADEINKTSTNARVVMREKVALVKCGIGNSLTHAASGSLGAVKSEARLPRIGRSESDLLLHTRHSARRTGDRRDPANVDPNRTGENVGYAATSPLSLKEILRRRIARRAPLVRLFRIAHHLGLLCRIFNRRWYQSDRASSLTRANNCRCSVLRDS